MTPAETHRFRELIERYFEARRVHAGFRENGALAINGNFAGAPFLDLDKLEERCLLAKPRDWEAVVREHLDRVLRLSKQGEHAESHRPTDRVRSEEDRLDDLAIAKGFLAAAPVRLESLRSSPAGKDKRRGLVYRRDLEGLPTVLFLNLETGLVPVERSLFEKWGERPSALFRIALSNVRREVKPERGEVDLGGGRKGIILRSDSDLTAAHAYSLGAVPGASGKLGSLFAIPHSRCIVACPAEAPEDLECVPQLVEKAARLRASQAETTSIDVYHWNGKTFRRMEAGQPEKVVGA
jgi:hypothetical protein